MEAKVRNSLQVTATLLESVCSELEEFEQVGAEPRLSPKRKYEWLLDTGPVGAIDELVTP